MGDLDREKAREIATKIARGDYDRADDAVDALEGCVLPDFRIAALEAAIETKERAYYAAGATDWTGRRTGPATDFTAYELRTILRRTE